MINVDAEQPPAPNDDSWWVQQARERPSAFAELYTRHAERIYRYVMARVGNTQDAQDITAQTFLDAFKGLHNYNERWSFSAWITGIAHNKTVDHYRKRRNVVPLEDAYTAKATEPTPDEIVFQRIQLSQVREGMKKLIPERAEVIALRLFGGLNTAETAQIMGKSEGSVKMLLYRALRDLRAIIGDDTDE